MKNYYEILDLKECSSVDEIKRAYRSLALRHHPDRGGDVNKMVEINEAYEYLMLNKRSYDELFQTPVRHRQGFTIIVGGFGMQWDFDVALSATTVATVNY